MDRKNLVFHVATTSLLIIVFLGQSVSLNFTLITYFNSDPYSFLWFLPDFFCLLFFSLDSYLAYRRACVQAKNSGNNRQDSRLLNQQRPNSRISTASSTSQYNWPNNTKWFGKLTKVPMTYMCWIVYSGFLIAKIAVIFKTGIPESPSRLLHPQAIKLCIGVTAIMYTLVVEVHKDSRKEPMRNAFVNSLSFGIAGEILDSVSFLSMLIVSQSGLVYSFAFENFVIGLASLNLMLPSIGLYSLSASEFGKDWVVPLDAVYKLLHVIFINGAYLGVRVYLWLLFTPDTSIFIIKNIYSILIFFRDIPADLQAIRRWVYARKDIKRITPLGEEEAAEEMKMLGLEQFNVTEAEIGDLGGGGDAPETSGKEKLFTDVAFGATRRLYIGKIDRVGTLCKLSPVKTYKIISDDDKKRARAALYSEPGKLFILECFDSELRQFETSEEQKQRRMEMEEASKQLRYEEISISSTIPFPHNGEGDERAIRTASF